MNDNKVVLITGASGGFGLLTAKTLAKAGHKVYATMRGVTGKNENKARELEKWAATEKVDVTVVELDVADDTSVANGVKTVFEDAGRIDVTINNAGVGSGGPDEAITNDQFRNIFEVNVFGVHRINREVLPIMRKQRSGLLINISSLLGRLTVPFFAAYNSSKYALEGLIESIRPELEPFGVDAVIIEPGAYPTDFGANVIVAGDTQRVAEYGPVAEVPGKMFEGMGQMFASNPPDPQDVADAAKKLIDTPHGERPLRTVVTVHTKDAVEDINDKSRSRGTALAEAFGVFALLDEAKAQLSS